MDFKAYLYSFVFKYCTMLGSSSSLRKKLRKSVYCEMKCDIRVAILGGRIDCGVILDCASLTKGNGSFLVSFCPGKAPDDSK